MSFLRQFVVPNTWVRALIIFVIAWGFLVYVFVSKLNTVPVTEEDNTMKRLNQAFKLLESSRQRNEELKLMIDEFISDQMDKNTGGEIIHRLRGQFEMVPSLEYERQRRRVSTNIQEMWNFFSSELGKIGKLVENDMPQLFTTISGILELGVEHKRSLLSDMDRIRTVDGYEKWRQKEALDLSNLVQRRLIYLQNPKDCKTARKLVCKLNKGCGYGCQLHHAVYCFIVAYATERTLILKSKGWRYHKGGWEEVFKPVSETCTEAEKGVPWPGKDYSTVLNMPFIDSLIERPQYLPLAIPEDLAPRLKRLHGDPIVWWVGQFLKYLLRPQPATWKMINTGMEKLGWKKPIVGVHVRRTDKVGTEASYHRLEEYMSHVEDYFLTLEMYNNSKIDRRIFLASDDARVIEEAKQKYKTYEIIGDPDIARMAGLSTRYTDSSLNGIVLDIHMLSQCDYIVCTFSSQVCRVAYEIMQTIYPDAAQHFKSLDDIYYYGGQNAHNREVILPHNSDKKDEIQLRPGDLVGIAGNHWNGFSKGKNTRTHQTGLFPSFKVNDKIETVKLPTYSDA